MPRKFFPYPPKALPLVSILLAALLGSPLARAATCTTGSGVSTIGTEAFATQAFIDGTYRYDINTLSCSSGSVTSWLTTNFEGTPEGIIDDVLGQQLNMSRLFRNQCASMILVVHNNFRGAINDGTGAVNLSLSNFPLNQTYYDVFTYGIAPNTGTPLSCDCQGGLVKQNSAVCESPPPIKPPRTCPVGNPISPGLGCKLQRETDYAFSDGPLNFTRHYDSQSPYHQGNSARRAMGNRWRHNHDVTLNPAVAPNQALMLRGDGQILYFQAPSSGTIGFWPGDPDSTASLERTASGWLWRDTDNTTERFDTAGRLLQRTTPDGQSLHYTYPAGSTSPTRIEDDFGRALTLVYNGKGLLTRVTTPAGEHIDYGYDSAGNLIQITQTDLSTRQYSYTSRTVGTRAEPALLTGIVDEQNIGYASWDYNAQAKAISSAHAGGTQTYSVAYQQNAAGEITAASVTNPLGGISEYSFTRLHGADLLTSQTLPIPGGATQTRGYDANGNLASHLDYGGTLTTYAYDLARNLETSRIEGLAASGAPQAETRTISTAWHPDWRLRSAQAAPRLITRWVYNGQTDPSTSQTAACAPAQAVVAGSQPLPVLCTRIEQPTGDADGSAAFSAQAIGTPRIWRYTYDEHGRLLTEDGPRTDLADITTHEYWPANATCPGATAGAGLEQGCRGQLKQTTNPAGHVTSHLQYNAHGQLLHWQDPNGIDHLLTYDARQRLTSRSDAGLVTTYQYDARGLLTRVTAPDGSHIQHHYDDARRLTAVSDALNNRIDYTLDASGNRTSESVRDAANQLRQAISREFDALSRLSTETLGVTAP